MERNSKRFFFLNGWKRWQVLSRYKYFFYFIVKYDSKIAVYNANGAFGLVFIVKKEKKENNEFAINIDNE